MYFKPALKILKYMIYACIIKMKLCSYYKINMQWLSYCVERYVIVRGEAEIQFQIPSTHWDKHLFQSMVFEIDS